MKLSTNTPLDKMLNGGIEDDAITNVYGPAGSGKTNIVLCTVLNCIRQGYPSGGKKMESWRKNVIYIDTEGSFSLERFRQLGGREKELEHIMFLNPSTWREQHTQILKLEKIIKKDTGLIAIDSLVALYRLELDQNNFQKVNKQLATQYSVLSKITRQYKIPVIVTNQVYGHRSGLNEERIELTSNTIGKYWGKALIELQKLERDNTRVAILRKHRSIPEGKKIEFEIVGNGLKSIGKFGLF